MPFRFRPMVLRVLRRSAAPPFREQRDALLRQQLGERLEIREWEPPENPKKLYEQLWAKLYECLDQGPDTRPVAVEAAVFDPVLLRALAVARNLGVLMFPLLVPVYLDQDEVAVPDRNFRMDPGEYTGRTLRFHGYWIVEAGPPAGQIVPIGELFTSPHFRV